MRTISLGLSIGLSVVLLTFLTSHQFPKAYPSTSAQSRPIKDSLLEAGKQLYDEYCAGCHGAKIQAFADNEWAYGSSSKSIYRSIEKGRGKGAMPAFGESFSEEQIKRLVEYIEFGMRDVGAYVFEQDFNPRDTFQSGEMQFRLELLTDALESPWGMAFLPNGDIIATDKEGFVNRIEPSGAVHPIQSIPKVNPDGQGGMLDIELHPNFPQNKYIYLSYSIIKKVGRNELTSTAVSRYRLEGDRLTNEELVFEAKPYEETRHHYGSRMEFDQEGYLFISVGDRGVRSRNPQSLKHFPGKIHRVMDDGSIPSDNPFVGQEGAVGSIYSYGHRNPQGLILDPATGILWEHEHGPRGGDELNNIQKGKNYGWPTISYGINYDGSVFTNLTEKEGLEQPVHYWVPSIGPCGMAFVTSEKYPDWVGSVLVGSLKYEYVNLCKLENNRVTSEEKLLKNIGRVRNIKQSPDGFLYVATEEPGRIYKIIPLN